MLTRFACLLLAKSLRNGCFFSLALLSFPLHLCP
jgi:hypothetical protein